MLLDTVCTVTLYQPADQDLVEQALDLVADYESRFSATIEGSQVWELNHSQGCPVDISPDTAEMLNLGLHFGALSQGRLDITIGRVTDLWDFGEGGTLPDRAELQAALDTVDYRQLKVSGTSDSGYSACLEQENASLDPGAVAKGYIADRVVAFLQEQGVTQALVDLGGNIVTLGEKEDGQPWRIAIEAPFSDRTEIIGSLSLEEAAVVTSGVYQRQFVQDGKLYHHILDPETGYPVETDVVSVTVVCPSSAQGDCLSTLGLLLGLDAGMEFLAEQDGVYGSVWVDAQGEIYTQGDLDFEVK